MRTTVCRLWHECVCERE